MQQNKKELIPFNSKYLRFLVPVATGMFLLIFPLVGDFHIESAIMVAVVGTFWAGIRGCRKPKDSDFRAGMILSGYLYLVGIPLLVNAVAAGCFSWHGLGFWLLYPLPGVFFGYSIGRLLRIWNVPYRAALTLIILGAVAAGGFLVEFFTLPQVYFFNHVWGGWPGPIYDEAIHIGGSLVFFRGITLGWILIFWYMPHYYSAREARWIVGLSVLFLTFCYINLAEMGVVTPEKHLQRQFSSRQETAHFNIYYDGSHFDGDAAGIAVREHEFYYQQIIDTLNIERSGDQGKIHSYLYGHPWQKKKRVGAKYTSYVPVWLDRDQLHIARGQLASLKHELVHVLAKQFGNNVFNASWSIGLVEGLAVALSPDRSATSTVDQLVAARKPYPGASEMKNALSFSGFYRGRSTVNYATTGSFIRFLLRQYPVRYLKEMYGSGSLEWVYPVSFDTLITRWHDSLALTPVDSVDRQTADRLFARRSLFEKECPHILSEKEAMRDRVRYYLAERDTAAALEKLKKMTALYSEDAEIKGTLLEILLRRGNVDSVVSRYTPDVSSTRLKLVYADAFWIAGRSRKARSILKELVRSRASKSAEVEDAAIAVRLDSLQWREYVRITYGNKLPSIEKFGLLYYNTKVKAMERAIERRAWSRVPVYGRVLARQPVSRKYMDAYFDWIHWLAYRDEEGLAGEWISRLGEMNLRPRYREKLDRERDWIRFLDISE